MSLVTPDTGSLSPEAPSTAGLIPVELPAAVADAATQTRADRVGLDERSADANAIVWLRALGGQAATKTWQRGAYDWTKVNDYANGRRFSASLEIVETSDHLAALLRKCPSDTFAVWGCLTPEANPRRMLRRARVHSFQLQSSVICINRKSVV